MPVNPHYMIKAQRAIRLLLLLSLLSFALLSCQGRGGGTLSTTITEPGAQTTPVVTSAPSNASILSSTPTAVSSTPRTKWELWLDGPHLRGANVYQRRVYPELDGPAALGPGPTGPPYTLDDYKRLASLGANYVNISQPGLFDEKPPFGLNEEMQASLDEGLKLAQEADLFAVISARSGPGRSEFTFYFSGQHSWFDSSYYNDTIWTDPAAQDAWVAMWRYTAERYRDNPIVVGYDLMVEPNCNSVCFSEWEADKFFSRVKGTPYDWNALARRVTAAIREVDPETPILLGGEGYSRVDWLPYLELTGDAHTVYMVHQYDIYQYTHQRPGSDGSLPFTYPGTILNGNRIGSEAFDRAWLQRHMGYIERFQKEHDVPIGVNEFGVMRWEPGAAEFMQDQLALFEEYKMNNAIWVWYPSWAPQAETNPWQFLHGPDPSSHSEAPNALFDVIREYWSRNQIRPSNWR